VDWPGSASLRGGLVPLEHAGRDAAAVADRDAVVFRPRPDVGAAPPAFRCPGGTCQKIAAIPAKRAAPAETHFLERDETAALSR